MKNATDFAMRFVGKSSQILNCFSSHSLEKITHSSGGKYECVFETEPPLTRTIEVKSKLIYYRSKVAYMVEFYLTCYADVMMFIVTD